jgi:hypothetical protein
VTRLPYAHNSKEPRTTCESCGGSLRFDPKLRGKTCGGFDLVGWCVCDACNVVVLCPARSKPADAVDWSLAKGGRSVNAGGIRLRAEAGADADDLLAVMARVVRVPVLEAVAERALAALRDNPMTEAIAAELTAELEGA